MEDHYANEYDPSPCLDESDFEDDFFSYNPDEDPNGSRGIGLADVAFSKAKRDHLPIELWILEHRMNYNYRTQQVS